MNYRNTLYLTALSLSLAFSHVNGMEQSTLGNLRPANQTPSIEKHPHPLANPIIGFNNEIAWDQATLYLSGFLQKNINLQSPSSSVDLTQAGTDWSEKFKKDDQLKSPKINYCQYHEGLLKKQDQLFAKLNLLDEALNKKSLTKNSTHRIFLQSSFNKKLTLEYIPLLEQLDPTLNQYSERRILLNEIIHHNQPFTKDDINKYKKSITKVSGTTNYTNNCTALGLLPESSTILLKNSEQTQINEAKYLSTKKFILEKKFNKEAITINEWKNYLSDLKSYRGCLSCKQIRSEKEEQTKLELTRKIQSIEKFIHTQEINQNKKRKQQKKNNIRITKINEYKMLLDSADSIDFDKILTDIIGVEQYLLSKTTDSPDQRLETITLLSQMIDLLDRKYDEEMRLDYFEKISNNIQHLDKLLSSIENKPLINIKDNKEVIELMIAIHIKTLQKVTTAIINTLENTNFLTVNALRDEIHSLQQNPILVPYAQQIVDAIDKNGINERNQITHKEPESTQEQLDKKIYIHILQDILDSEIWTAEELQQILKTVPEIDTLQPYRQQLIDKIEKLSTATQNNNSIDPAFLNSYSLTEEAKAQQLALEQEKIKLEQEEQVSKKWDMIIHSSTTATRLIQQIKICEEIIPDSKRSLKKDLLTTGDYDRVIDAIINIQDKATTTLFEQCDYLLNLISDEDIKNYLDLNEADYTKILNCILSQFQKIAKNTTANLALMQYAKIMSKLGELIFAIDEKGDIIGEIENLAQEIVKKIIDEITLPSGQFAHLSRTQLIANLNIICPLDNQQLELHRNRIMRAIEGKFEKKQIEDVKKEETKIGSYSVPITWRDKNGNIITKPLSPSSCLSDEDLKDIKQKNDALEKSREKNGTQIKTKETTNPNNQTLFKNLMDDPHMKALQDLTEKNKKQPTPWSWGDIFRIPFKAIALPFTLFAHILTNFFHFFSVK